MNGRAVMLLLLVAWCLPALAARNAFLIRKGVNLNTPFMSDGGAAGADNRLAKADELHAILRRIADAKFDTIRLDIEPLLLVKSDPKQRGQLLKQILELTGWAEHTGLQTIVDIHVQWRDWQRSTPQQAAATPLFADYLEAVRQMAQTLAGSNPNRVALELFNEPQFSCSTQDAPAWNELNKKIFHEARSRAPALYIVVAGACWDKIDGLLRVKPSDFDDKTFYTFHFYEPDTFSAAGEPWASGPEREFTDLPFPPDRKDEDAYTHRFKQSVRAQRKDSSDELASRGEGKLHDYFSRSDWPRLINSRFDLVDKWAAANAIPHERIFVGEFGAYRGDAAHESSHEKARLEYLRTVFKTAEKHGFGAIVWQYYGVMGITQTDADSPINAEIASW